MPVGNEQIEDVNAQEATTNQGNPAENDPVEQYEDDDPMLKSMREAEAEIAAEAEGKPADQPAEDQPQGEPKQAIPAAEPKGQPQGGDNNKSPMIPKARFDDVLSERDHYRQATTYLQGIVDTQTKMLKEGVVPTAKAEGEPIQGQEQGGQAAPKPAANAIETQITSIEDKKIDLGEKYENGEISFVEMQKGLIEADRQIRALDEQRLIAISESAKNTAVEVVSANNRQMQINNEAVRIQEQHPYVAEIDALPAGIRDGVWAEITKEAAQNLAAKGINPNDGSAASRLALIQEKAALTNVYGPRYTGKSIQPTNANGNDKRRSETAQQRAAKLDLADQQPPELSPTGAQESRELTAKDIENMTQDEVADALQRNPKLLEKVAGFR